MGSRTLFRSSAFTGSHSTSKKCAWSAAGPFSSTSSQRAFPAAMPMWLGTVSSTSLRPLARRVSANEAKPTPPPSSGFTWVWSTTSYPWLLPGIARRMGEA